LDTVSDRDFALEALLKCRYDEHISKIFGRDNPCGAIVSSTSLKLSDRHSTGSSIMPQKKESQIFRELLRGKMVEVMANLNWDFLNWL